ncbi:myosin light chain kinase, smooth muscle-like [Artemia franciscana]
MKSTKISTDKLKKFIIRRKWQKTGTAIRAISRMASMSSRRSSSASSRRTSRLDSLSDELDFSNLAQLASVQLGNKPSGAKIPRNNTSSAYSERSDSGYSDVFNSVPRLRHQESIVEEFVANGELVCDTGHDNAKATSQL